MLLLARVRRSLGLRRTLAGRHGAGGAIPLGWAGDFELFYVFKLLPVFHRSAQLEVWKHSPLTDWQLYPAGKVNRFENCMAIVQH